jgi:hypothetical protein
MTFLTEINMISKINIRGLQYFTNTNIEFGKITVFTGRYDFKIAIFLNLLLKLRRYYIDDKLYDLYQHLDDLTIADNPAIIKIKNDTQTIGLKFQLDKQPYVRDWSLMSRFDLFNDNFCFIGSDRLQKRYHKTSSNQCVINGHISSDECYGDCDAIGHYIYHHNLVDSINDQLHSIVNHDENIDIHKNDQNEYHLFGYVDAHKELVGIDKIPHLSAMTLCGGVLAILPILACCLTYQFNNLLIISMPELGLHADSQSKLIRFITGLVKYNVQIILVSQSDHIFNGLRVLVKQQQIKARDVLIHHTTEASNMVSPFERVYMASDGSFPHEPEGFLDQWEKDLMCLL